MTQFQITGDYIELVKLLKAAGVCGTGGMAKIVIEQGQISVDGRTELRKRCKIRKGQTVTFENTVIEVQ